MPLKITASLVCLLLTKVISIMLCYIRLILVILNCQTTIYPFKMLVNHAVHT